ncbi:MULTISPECIES: copper chaperone PCu(A)C [Streptomyces]|uniref:Copper chaperone PCu(A)C n=1 Tax=Streptomyces sudanensis TaxID=436397 RepID=A0ABY4TE30_9ACTN|nr:MULTISPECIES: copper chaperone PCu(A)C [Streptomyces]MCP9958546.1 copper chaperone PCu(A)C [Streptomyces sudanensis]MCP9987663.1 copper chaperone PCu(A)C [Streptomyces sudanensis]MCQ0000944.1 copper chaperone PCu(A)C [Streptomyces sudanensis]URN16528.1 copper chaperone PCu(A)C [Streptomyces sudanensis]
MKSLRERVGAVAPALSAVLASALALGGLTAWTAAGAAGSPARPEVTRARLLQPFAGRESTAVVFTVVNSGGSDDRLTSVTSPAITGAMLSQDADAGASAARMRMLRSVRVPARGVLEMTPYGTDVMVELREPVRLGQRVPFTLHFEWSRPVTVEALVVRHAQWASR